MVPNTFFTNENQIFIPLLENSDLTGEKWFSTCIKCHDEIGDCCRDLEMTLFPDEVENFVQSDGNNVKAYNDGTYAYFKKGACFFLNNDGSCDLNKRNKEKPIDCLIYPLNYKNGNIYLDKSCPAKEIIKESKNHAISILRKKIELYPQYKKIEYEILDRDMFIEEI